MSTKGSTKSQHSGLRNSFHVLSTLEDPVNNSGNKAKKAASGSNDSAPKAQEVKKVMTEKVSAVKAEAKPVVQNTQNKQKEAKKEAKKVIASVPVAKSHHQAAATSSGNQGPLVKMLFFALLMLVLPIGAYYWSVHKAGLDLGEMKSALVAVLVVNVLLFFYILMAFFEESKQAKVKTN